MKLNNASTPLRRSARLAVKSDKTAVASTTPTKKSPRQKERNDASGHDKTPDHRPTRTAGDRACQSNGGKSKREKKQDALTRAKRWSTERKPRKATGVDGTVVDELNDFMQGMSLNKDQKDRYHSITRKLRGAATNKSTGVARNLQFGDWEDDADEHSVRSDESTSPQAEAYESSEPVPLESRSDASSSDEDISSSSDEERNDDSSYVPEVESDDSFDWDFQKDENLDAGKPSSSSETSGTSYSYPFTAGLPDAKVDLGSDRNKAAAEGDRKRQEKAQEEAEVKEYAEQKRQEKKAAEEKRQAKMKEQADTIARVLSAKSHYSVFGVSKDVTTSDVARAYRQLARKVHPDKNTLPGAEDAFKAVQAAYEVLICPTKRAEYDSTYQSRFTRTTPQPPPQPRPCAFTSFADEIPIGTRVTFCNLNSASSYLQGQKGFVMGFSKASRQYKIKMDNFNGAFGDDFIIDADVGTFFQNIQASTRWYTRLNRTFGVTSVTVDSYRGQDDIYGVSHNSNFSRTQKQSWLRPHEILIPVGTIVRLWSPEHNGKYGKIVQFHERRAMHSCGCGSQQLCAVCDTSYYSVQIALNHFVDARMENMRL